MAKTSLDKKRIKIVLLEGIHASAVKTLEDDGYTNIECYPKALPEPQLIKAVRNAYFIGIRSNTQISARVLEEAPRLISIGCFCIGTNQVDLNAARDRGIAVFNAPFSNTRSVAELVIAELILLMRSIPQRNAEVHRGVWVKSAAGAREVRGKTLGVVGYGHIGTQVGVLAESFGMKVIYYDIQSKLALGNARPVPSLEALLKESDVVTLHVPETPQTKNMIRAEQLAAMKKGSYLINAARGTLIDIPSLVKALDAKHLAGAALDVFPTEPKSADDEFLSPLRAFDNVILTPHIGGSTEEAQEGIGAEVAGKLLKYSNNGSTLTSVNFPEVSLPEHTGQHRILHIHRNQPGVMSQINAIMSERQINICSQFLQTNPAIGYVVIDLQATRGDQTKQLKERLDTVAGTIRTRMLW